jgi:hypothetical protein
VAFAPVLMAFATNETGEHKVCSDNGHDKTRGAKSLFSVIFFPEHS